MINAASRLCFVLMLLLIFTIKIKFVALLVLYTILNKAPNQNNTIIVLLIDVDNLIIIFSYSVWHSLTQHLT